MFERNHRAQRLNHYLAQPALMSSAAGILDLLHRSVPDILSFDLFGSLSA